jgi:hypothetical protein
MLFIGYSFNDLYARMLFSYLESIGGERVTGVPKLNIAVARPPLFPEDHKQIAIDYLSEYFKKLYGVATYWGDIASFTSEMRKRWNSFKTR